MKNPEKKNKHMQLEDRIEIQECLCKRMTFKAIAKRIGKDPTTVSKEVKLHATNYVSGFTKTNDVCPKLLKAPFVCNGCEKQNHANCTYPRRKYVAKTAQKEYETVLVESREGIPLTKEEFYYNERIISEAVKGGQHIYHAIKANDLSVSKSTVYRHINNGYYEISRIDLPRAVKFKSRRAKKEMYVPQGIRINRAYTDFLAFTQENPNCSYVEMDTVIGRIGGKVIMTFQFVNVDFMFGLLLDDKSSAEASEKISMLKHKLKNAGFSFSQFFPALLTDNGGEFCNVFAFENDLDGTKETSLFFCDPNCSYQKPHVENNHTLFRNIVPKGKSFDAFSQDTVDLIFSHVNSVKRKQFNGKSAYDMFSFTYSDELAHVLGIERVDSKKVIQSPILLADLLDI
ncbi:MAG: IS30 family transposase [Clostridia bacterium]|nr:IS30 family transposase [Clostridia bacterium]